MLVRAWMRLWLLRRDEEGASSVEYGLLAVAIAAAITVIVFVLGDVVFGLFDQTCDNVSTQVNGAACP